MPRGRLRPWVPGLLLLGMLLVGTAPVGAEDEAEPAVPAAMQARINAAIEKGAAWLAERQQGSGAFKLRENKLEGPGSNSKIRFGVAALCTYTLADCGYGPDHKVVKKAVAYLRKRYRSMMKGDHYGQASSYSLSLMVLALHTLYVKPERRDAVEERDRYGHSRGEKRAPCEYPKWVEKAIEQILDWLLEHQDEQGLFRYPGGFAFSGRWQDIEGRGPNFAGPEDLSNTQYVLLALWAGTRCGYDVPDAVLEKVARRLLAVQEKDGWEVLRTPDPAPGAAPQKATAPPVKRGADVVVDRARGFPYAPGDPGVTGSMTAAGLSSLLIVKAILLERGGLKPDLRKAMDRGIWDGLAWLSVNCELEHNVGLESHWHYYALHAIERACVIARKRYLGDHDWYREGAALLVDAQEDDGAWRPGGQLGGIYGVQGAAYQTHILDTCFALLFLKRATLVPEVPVLDDPVTTPREK